MDQRVETHMATRSAHGHSIIFAWMTLASFFFNYPDSTASRRTAAVNSDVMWRGIIYFLFLALTMSCSRSVPPETVPGTYVASYPFGTETLTLNSDGSFTHQIEIKGETPITTTGTWEFDSKESYVRLNDFLSVVDGFGHLKSDWRATKPAPAALPAGRLWFRITIDSGAEYPYVKQ